MKLAFSKRYLTAMLRSFPLRSLLEMRSTSIRGASAASDENASPWMQWSCKNLPKNARLLTLAARLPRGGAEAGAEKSQKKSRTGISSDRAREFGFALRCTSCIAFLWEKRTTGAEKVGFPQNAFVQRARGDSWVTSAVRRV